MESRFSWLALALLAVCVPRLAIAHDLAPTSVAFSAGLSHPWSGPDHLLAMFGVGLWAGQRGGRARWWVPLAFLAALVLGGGVGHATGRAPGVELGIAASVVAVGVFVALAAAPPVRWVVAGVMAFALLHGHAHGSEIPPQAPVLGYGAGFVLGTAILHGVGLALAEMLERSGRRVALRALGGAVAAAGLALWLRL